MQESSKDVDLISNNIANVATIGFKSSHGVFSDLTVGGPGSEPTSNDESSKVLAVGGPASEPSGNDESSKVVTEMVNMIQESRAAEGGGETNEGDSNNTSTDSSGGDGNESNESTSDDSSSAAADADASGD
jgi:flagellar basal body rod protein FlgG